MEGETAIAVEQATNARQHFPSLEILCLSSETPDAVSREQVEQQKIALIETDIPEIQFRRRLRTIMSASSGNRARRRRASIRATRSSGT